VIARPVPAALLALLCCADTVLAGSVDSTVTKITKSAKQPKPPVAERPEWGSLATRAGDALVAVKFVLQMKGAKGSDRSSEEEAFCLLIDQTGIVLCPTGYLGLSPQSPRRGLTGLTATPGEFKVLVGDDPEGYEARLLARDVDLELAWLQIKSKVAALPSLDLTARAEPQIGDRVLTLGRTPRYLGRSALVSENSIGGSTDRPRKLLLLGSATAPGVPVFARSGALIGVTIAQRIDEGERQSFGQRMPGLVLPVEELAAATRRAQEPPAAEPGADAGKP
jgi:hypothetical protein